MDLEFREFDSRGYYPPLPTTMYLRFLDTGLDNHFSRIFEWLHFDIPCAFLLFVLSGGLLRGTSSQSWIIPKDVVFIGKFHEVDKHLTNLFSIINSQTKCTKFGIFV